MLGAAHTQARRHAGTQAASEHNAINDKTRNGMAWYGQPSQASARMPFAWPMGRVSDGWQAARLSAFRTVFTQGMPTRTARHAAACAA